MTEHPKLPGMRRGGKRKNAGRKPSGQRSQVSHAKRLRVVRYHPVMITMRIKDDIPNLRNGAILELFQKVLRAMRGFEGSRVIHFSLQTNHVHLTVEADSTTALSKGMQSLSIRFARAMNRLLGRKGKVLADRYHVSEMKTPLETRNKLAYVLCNANYHRQDFRLSPGSRGSCLSLGTRERGLLSTCSWLRSYFCRLSTRLRRTTSRKLGASSRLGASLSSS